MLNLGNTVRAALVAILGAVPVVLFALYLETLLEEQQERANNGQFRRAAENFALNVEQKLRSELGALEGLTSSTALDSGDFVRFRNEMERLQSAHPDWFTVVLADGQRQLANLRFKGGEPLPIPNDPATQQKILTSGKPALGTLVAGRIGIGAPVFRDGVPRYVIAAVASPDLFVSSLQQYHLAAGRVATLADSAGNIIGRSDQPAAYTGRPLGSEFSNPPPSELNKVFEATTSAGVPSVGILTPVGDFGWTVLLQAPKTAFAASFLPIRAAVWTGAGIVVLLTIILLTVTMKAAASLRTSQALLQANDSLQMSEERYARLANATVEGVAVHENDLIIEVNDAFCRMFGYTSDDAIGQAPVELIEPAARAEFLQHIRTCDERPYETLGIRSDGSAFPIEIVARNLDHEDRHLRVKLIRDLTEQKEAEAALRDSQRQLRETQAELLHVSRVTEMGQMAAALAHEINQPLTAVINYLSASRGLLGSAPDGKTLDDLRHILGRADQQALLATEIVRRLRNFMSHGETERKFESARETFEEATALALAGTPHRDVEVRRTIYTDAQIFADKVQIQQVLVNVIRNAIEAMEASPRKELEIAARDGADGVEVRISDTGSGLSPEIVDRLFQPFATTKSNGMGIGLSVCRTIIEAHEGLMGAEPRPGGGTVFWFKLPTEQDDGRLRNYA